MSIFTAAGQHGPGDAGQFVGDRHYDLVPRSTLTQPVHPLSKSCSVVLDTKEHCAGTMDQHATEIDVAALADTEQLLFAPGRVLSRHDPNPRRKNRALGETL